jgi:Putative zinc-finger
MMMHPGYDELNDYADALLDEPRAAAVRTHLMGCTECSETVDQLDDLRATARALPRSVAAPAEVWAVVRAATIDNTVAQHRRVLWQLRYQLAAAAVVLLMVASSLTWWIASQRPPTMIVQGGPAGNIDLVAYRTAEAGYTQAAADLMNVLEQRRERMDTAVVRSVEENLRVMDNAIRNARAALLSDPANSDLAALLAATQESKLRMLRRAVGAVGGT